MKRDSNDEAARICAPGSKPADTDQSVGLPDGTAAAALARLARLLGRSAAREMIAETLDEPNKPGAEPPAH